MTQYTSPNAVTRDGPLLVMADGARTAARCIKCNEPVRQEPIAVPLQWDKADGATDPVSTVIALATSRNATVYVYCCPAHLPRKNPLAVALMIVMMAGFGLFFALMMDLGTVGRWSYPLVFGIAMGIIFAVARKSPVRAVRIQDGRAWVTGAGEAFLKTLPEEQPISRSNAT